MSEPHTPQTPGVPPDAPEDSVTVTPPGSERAGFWAGRSAFVVPATLFAVGIFLIVGIVNIDIVNADELFGPRAFPTIAAVICFVLGVLLVVDVIRNPEEPELIHDDDGQQINARTSNWRATGIAIGSFVLFAIVLLPAGWIIAGALAFWGITIGMGNTRYVFNLLLGLAISSIMQLVFGGMLGLTLPAGIFGLF